MKSINTKKIPTPRIINITGLCTNIETKFELFLWLAGIRGVACGSFKYALNAVKHISKIIFFSY